MPKLPYCNSDFDSVIRAFKSRQPNQRIPHKHDVYAVFLIIDKTISINRSWSRVGPALLMKRQDLHVKKSAIRDISPLADFAFPC